MATTLNSAIFDLNVENHELIKLAYDCYLANSRSSHAKTLTRAEVRGGGKKPWKQKGTGRARFGSTRNPIWRHGGVAFGRTGIENFRKKLSKAAKRQAICQALSLKNAAQGVFVIPKLTFANGKVKETLKQLQDAKLDASKNTLLVLAVKDEKAQRATRNIANIKAVKVNYLNVFDILNADQIIFEQDALAPLNTWLDPQSTKKEEA